MGQVAVIQPSVTLTRSVAEVGMLAQAGLILSSDGADLHRKYEPMLMRWLASDATPKQGGIASPSGSEIASGMLPVQLRL